MSIQPVVLLQPLVFLLQPPKAAPAVPPAPASRGRLCYRGGLTAPTIPTAGQALRRGSLTLQPKQSTHVLPSAWASTTASSPALRRPLPRPRRRPPPWCSRHGVVNVVNERLPSEEYSTWRG